MPPRHNVAKEDPDHNLYERGEVYWCRYVLGGTEHRVSLRTTNVAAARKERNKLLKAADDARDGKPIARVHVWEDAVSVFLVNVLDVGKKYSPSTAKRYQVSLRQLGPVLEGTPLDEITTGTVSDYVKARQQEGVSVSTIRNELTAWSMVMSFAASERMVDGNQLRAYEREWLGEDEDALDPPLDAEAAEMVREVSGWSQDIAAPMVWLRETGMRLGEALHAMAEDGTPRPARHHPVPGS
jgi:integrase/recombinase XerD